MTKHSNKQEIPSYQLLSDYVNDDVETEEKEYPVNYKHPHYNGCGILINEDHTSSLILYDDDEEEGYRLMKFYARSTDEYFACTPPREKANYVQRFVAKCILQRKLKKGEVVDHLDRDPMNNNVSNLQVVTQSKNMKNIDRTNYHCFVLNKKNEILKECKTLTDIVLFTGIKGPIVKAMIDGEVEIAINKKTGNSYKLQRLD